MLKRRARCCAGQISTDNAKILGGGVQTEESHARRGSTLGAICVACAGIPGQVRGGDRRCVCGRCGMWRGLHTCGPAARRRLACVRSRAARGPWLQQQCGRQCAQRRGARRMPQHARAQRPGARGCARCRPSQVPEIGRDTWQKALASLQALVAGGTTGPLHRPRARRPPIAAKCCTRNLAPVAVLSR